LPDDVQGLCNIHRYRFTYRRYRIRMWDDQVMPMWDNSTPGGGGKGGWWKLLVFIALGLLLAYICNAVGGFEMLDSIMGGKK
jgi:hypothetical protein